MKKTKIMKNLKPKTMKFITNTFYLSLFTMFLISINSCKDDPTPDCGCNSETTTIIPETPLTIGQISYKEQINTDDNYYTNKYWIGFVEPNCSNCIHHMIVCNENMITNEIRDLINANGIVSIKFSGELKEICEKIFDVADVTYQRITLTKIELQ